MTKPNQQPVSSGQDNLNDSTVETTGDTSSLDTKPHLVGGDELDLLVMKNSVATGPGGIVSLDSVPNTTETGKEYLVKDGVTVADAAELVRSSFAKK